MQDFNGDLALFDAAKFGHTKVCELLMPTANSEEREKALALAKEHGYTECAEAMMAMMG